MPETLLIIGAAGRTGRELVPLLSAKGARVRAFVRDVDKAAHLQASGVELFQGDLEDGDSLREALDGASRLFLATSFNPKQVELQSRAVRAAVLSKVDHIVKLSILGASLDSIIEVIRWHALTEKEIEQSGLAFTHLRPHVFMHHFMMFAQVNREENLLEAPWKDARVSLVDARDVAAVASAVLTEEGHEGKTYTITGPEPLSCGEAAEILSEILGRPIRYADISLERYQADLFRAGRPGWMMDSLIGLAGFLGSGKADFVTPVVRQVAKTPGIPFRRFVRDNASAFGEPA